MFTQFPVCALSEHLLNSYLTVSEHLVYLYCAITSLQCAVAVYHGLCSMFIMLCRPVLPSASPFHLSTVYIVCVHIVCVHIVLCAIQCNVCIVCTY